MKHYDHLRTGLLLEPRGHADMYGAILSTSKNLKADLDCVFINTDGYSPMCRHAILAVRNMSEPFSPYGPTSEFNKSVS